MAENMLNVSNLCDSVNVRSEKEIFTGDFISSSYE